MRKLKETEEKQKEKRKSFKITFLLGCGDLKYCIEAAAMYSTSSDGTLDKTTPLDEGFYPNRSGTAENVNLKPEALGRLSDDVYVSSGRPSPC